MTDLYNIYCDESCHLNDPVTDANRFMVLGALSCADKVKQDTFDKIKLIKKAYDIKPNTEIKWTKVSNAKLDCYIEILKLFFENNNMRFRSVVIDKCTLRHEDFNQTHDQFYYKMYWSTIERLIEPTKSYNIYLDIKDTQGIVKVIELKRVLENSKRDFKKEIIKKIQEVRSHEVSILQITDLLIGAISYANRFPDGGKSAAKNTLVRYIKQRAGLSLKVSSLSGATKFNLFHWEGRR
jgi:Protein of unknown function (DUF3800)